jgi:hypothetical protein
LFVRDTFGGGGIPSPDAPGGGPLGGCQLPVGVELVDASGGTEVERIVGSPRGAPEILRDAVDRLIRFVTLNGDSISTGLEWIKPLLTSTCGVSTFGGIREWDKLTGRVSPRLGGLSFRLAVGAGPGGVCVRTESGNRWIALGGTMTDSARDWPGAGPDAWNVGGVAGPW